MQRRKTGKCSMRAARTLEESGKSHEKQQTLQAGITQREFEGADRASKQVGTAQLE